MRISFLRGIITGSILAAAVSAFMGPQKKPVGEKIIGRVRPRTKGGVRDSGVLRSVGRTVNEMGKTVHEYIKK